MIDTTCESNINTVAEEIVSTSENIASQLAEQVGSYIHSDDIIIANDG